MAETVQLGPWLWHGSGGTSKDDRAHLPRVAMELFMVGFNLDHCLAMQAVVGERDPGVKGALGSLLSTRLQALGCHCWCQSMW